MLALTDNNSGNRAAPASAAAAALGSGSGMLSGDGIFEPMLSSPALSAVHAAFAGGTEPLLSKNDDAWTDILDGVVGAAGRGGGDLFSGASPVPPVILLFVRATLKTKQLFCAVQVTRPVSYVSLSHYIDTPS